MPQGRHGHCPAAGWKAQQRAGPGRSTVGFTSSRKASGIHDVGPSWNCLALSQISYQAGLEPTNTWNSVLTSGSSSRQLTETGNESLSVPISPRAVPQFLQNVLAWLKGG